MSSWLSGPNAGGPAGPQPPSRAPPSADTSPLPFHRSAGPAVEMMVLAVWPSTTSAASTARPARPCGCLIAAEAARRRTRMEEQGGSTESLSVWACARVCTLHNFCCAAVLQQAWAPPCSPGPPGGWAWQQLRGRRWARQTAGQQLQPACCWLAWHGWGPCGQAVPPGSVAQQQHQERQPQPHQQRGKETSEELLLRTG